VNQVLPFLVVTLGSLYISLTTLPHTSDRPLFSVLFASCFVNASVLAVGTLIGIHGMLGVPLFGIGFFAALLAAKVDYTALGMIVAVVFSVGVGLAGLPGGRTSTAAWETFWLCLSGGLFGLVGVAIHVFLLSRKIKLEELKEVELHLGISLHASK
jgi:hypothetical protein